MLFAAANQYGRMQWNTGVRYLMPVVPFLFLAAANHLARMRGRVARDPRRRRGAPRVGRLDAAANPSLGVFGDWERFLREGPRLPWLDVLARHRDGPRAASRPAPRSTSP